jgi:linear primary-alkylsulfatase
MSTSTERIVLGLAASLLCINSAIAQTEATQVTKKANAEVMQRLPFGDKQDFEDAKRGFIGSLEETAIKDSTGRVVWDIGDWDFVKGQAPESVNPSLWRLALLNVNHGLFKVTDGIYQVRGFDISVVSFIQTDAGWIVVDPLISQETAAAARQLFEQHFGPMKVAAVLYTHSHIDHYGGVRGFVSQAEYDSKKIPIIAPVGFMDHAISENVYAGTAMSRRSQYMYGITIPRGVQGQVDTGLGKSTSTGTVGLFAPTDIIERTGEKRTIGGLELVFQNAPGAEAPAEFLFYIPKYKALCGAELSTHNLHNLYTLRGAEVRDSVAWAKHLEQTRQLFGDKTEVLFASHHWPTWGQEKVDNLLSSQRDLYKYIHDQTLRLVNHGYTMDEIGDMIELSPELAKRWPNRGYYGSLNHDARAVYNKYIGYFDGNPAHLWRHPPEPLGERYVDFMGGPDEVLRKAQVSFEAGDYRWVAEVVSHVVFADPNNKAAKELEAAALEQLGYQAENATWRNFYLTGARELRQGKPGFHSSSASADTISAMTEEMLLDYLGIRLNGPQAADVKLNINLNLSDTGRSFMVSLDRGVLNYWETKPPAPDATLTLSRKAFEGLALGAVTMQQLIDKKAADLKGDQQLATRWSEMFDSFSLMFDVVTP